MYNVGMSLDAASSFYEAISCRRHRNDGRLSVLSVDFKVPTEKEFVARSVQKDLSHQARLLSTPLLTDAERASFSRQGR